MSPVINPQAAIPPPPAPSEQACSWGIDTACCPTWDSYAPELQASATAWATNILWRLTGRRFGPCTVTVRPCGSGCAFAGGYMTYPVQTDGGWFGSLTGGGFFPYISNGTWFNCACVGACSCRAAQEVWLPGPVASVSEVSVEGMVLDPSAYRVDNLNTLVRTDGGEWPRCQDMNLSAPTDDHTLFVTYQRGTPVPPDGMVAAGMLACAFAKDCASGCGLPGNLSTLTRQGVEITMVDPTEELGAGLTGLPQVDLWIRSVNPAALAQRGTVWSPDVEQPRMVT